MKTHKLIPGTPEWLAYRAQHFNASDAPAMMGCSPHKTRNQLLHELHSTLAREFSDYAQKRILDPGHAFEALARPLADEIIGEELYPVVGSVGRLSASFDGLTMDERLAWEHKRLNEVLRAAFADMETIAPEFRESASGKSLPLYHRVQMEHQLIVSGAERVLFMVSEWDGDTLIEERHCWYYPDLDLRAEIVAGWAQFELDLAAYVPTETVVAPVGVAVTALPAVSVQVTGSISIKDNFKAFEVALVDFIEYRLIRKPETDQDFADLDLQIKALKGAESALDALEAQMLSQVEAVDLAKRTKDMLLEMARKNRLMAEKLLAARKDQIRVEQVQRGQKALAEHVASLNARLGKPYMPNIAADFAGAIKSKRTIESLQNAVDTTLAEAKIKADAIAGNIQANLATLREFAADHAFLFADTAQIVLKAPDDLTALVKLRISEHQAAEEKKAEALRESIRKEEQDKLAREQAQAELLRAQAAPEGAELSPGAQALNEAAGALNFAAAHPNLPGNLVPAAPEPEILQVAMFQQPSAPVSDGQAITLGQISERLGFALQASFLAEMGFTPLPRDKKRPAATLYHESDWPRICAALVAHIGRVSTLAAA